jgi:anti-sigma factor RsiW
MNISASDERLLHRFLDGALAGEEAVACRSRLAAEPALRQGLAGLQQLRAAFAEARQPVMAAPAGFTAGVLAAARRLPTQVELREAGDWDAVAGPGMVRLCRRLLLAAAVLFGLGLLSQSGLFGDGRADTLQAAPDEVHREMQRLDALPLLEPGMERRRQ